MRDGVMVKCVAGHAYESFSPNHILRNARQVASNERLRIDQHECTKCRSQLWCTSDFGRIQRAAISTQSQALELIAPIPNRILVTNINVWSSMNEMELSILDHILNSSKNSPQYIQSIEDRQCLFISSALAQNDCCNRKRVLQSNR